MAFWTTRGTPRWMGTRNPLGARQGGTEAVSEGRSIHGRLFKAIAVAFSLHGGGARFAEGLMDTPSQPPLYEPSLRSILCGL
jgi:hypothetical protein